MPKLITISKFNFIGYDVLRGSLYAVSFRIVSDFFNVFNTSYAVC